MELRCLIAVNQRSVKSAPVLLAHQGKLSYSKIAFENRLVRFAPVNVTRHQKRL